MYTPDLEQAPLPDARTLRRRRNPCTQLWRFLAIDVKMMRVIFHKH